MRATVLGTWRGRYSYDSSFQFPQGPGVFTLRLERGWWFGRIVGFCIDHEPPMSEEPSRIAGWVRGQSISFEKRYRTNWVGTPQGTKSLRDWLSEQGYPTESPLPGQRVSYKGVVEESGEIVRGNWHLVQEPVVIRSKGEDRFLPPTEASGTWIMKRLLVES